MRSTTVGWFTSIVRFLPVTADHIWLNRARPECRESISAPIEPTKITPRNTPRTSANPTAARDLAGLEIGGASISSGIQKGYHRAEHGKQTKVHILRRRSRDEPTASPCESRCHSYGTAPRPSVD